MSGARGSLEQRFWPKVDTSTGPDGCWVWTGCCNNKGYGRLGSGGYHGPTVYAHRASWELHNGPIPDGMNVLHRCDTPLCVNPKHLFLGTQKENLRDAVSKGRMARGSRQGSAKLTEDQARIIRVLGKTSLTQKYIAMKFGVSQALISNIANGRYWRHA